MNRETDSRVRRMTMNSVWKHGGGWDDPAKRNSNQSVDTSGVTGRSPECRSGVVQRQRGCKIDLMLDILGTLPTGGIELDVEDIADLCGVTPTRIYQYQASAMTKLRREARARGLDMSDVRTGLKMGAVK